MREYYIKKIEKVLTPSCKRYAILLDKIRDGSIAMDPRLYFKESEYVTVEFTLRSGGTKSWRFMNLEKAYMYLLRSSEIRANNDKHSKKNIKVTGCKLLGRA